MQPLTAMSDDTSKRGGPDRFRINVHQDHEVRYWSNVLGVSRDELERAVRAVGPTVEAVRRHLRR